MHPQAILSECVVEPELRHEILHHSQVFSPDQGRVLFHQGDTAEFLYFVNSGEVILTMRSEGKDILEMRAGSGSLLGLPAVVGSQPYSMTAKAVSGAEVFQLSVYAFNELIKNEPRMSLAVLRILASEIRSARQVITKAIRT
jgi:CRP-like cAMP-binding protein